MTFRCDMCTEISLPRTKMHKIVAGVRDVQYVDQATGDVIAEGFETTAEVKVCDICFDDINEPIV